MEAGKVRNLPRLERAVGCNKVRKGVVRSMYLYLDKQEFFFGISLLRKQGSPCLLRGPMLIYSVGCLYELIWMQYVKSVCGKMCLRTEISCIPWEKNGSEVIFKLILSEKNWFPTKTKIHQLSISDVKMLLLMGKHIKFVVFFVTAETRPCLLRFSALTWTNNMDMIRPLVNGDAGLGYNLDRAATEA